MTKQVYDDPKLVLNRVYTRSGDAGETGLANGRRISKDAPRIEAYGTVDELNAYVGMAYVSVQELASAAPLLARLVNILGRVQHELFNLGSLLATDPGEVHPRQARVTEADVRQIESEIDDANGELEKLPSFVLPGGCRLNAELHVCRTICRRAERMAVTLTRTEEVPEEALRYLNRLSDAFFVWSRWVCRVLGVPEVLWEPNRAASGEQDSN